MTRYTHPNLPNFISPAPFQLGSADDAIKYAAGWWSKASAQEITDLGFVEYVPPEMPDPEPASPVATPPVMIACALRINIEDSEVQTVNGAYQVAAIMMIDEGTFLVIFFSNLGSGEPFLVPNNGISSSIIEWGEEYAVIETRDAAGELITPACFGFSLYNF